jgi:Flp pilus assembly protein TadG
VRRRRGEDGVTTVEFALVFPLFIFLVGVGAYFGWMYFVQTQVDRAASRAARFAAVPTTDGTFDYCQGMILKQLNGDLYSGSTPASDVVISDGTGAVLTGTEGIVTDVDCKALNKVPSGFVKVRITHDFTNPFSFLIAPFTGTTNKLVLTGTGQVRVEHQ